MESSTSAAKLLDNDFLGMRCRLIDLAAALDRIDRASAGPNGVDPRIAQIRRGLEILSDGEANRAERLQLSLSLGCED